MRSLRRVLFQNELLLCIHFLDMCFDYGRCLHWSYNAFVVPMEEIVKHYVA